ncbi:MAG: hypothetical protein ACRDAT_04575 [Cetobacterium sp.]
MSDWSDDEKATSSNTNLFGSKMKENADKSNEEFSQSGREGFNGEKRVFNKEQNAKTRGFGGRGNRGGLNAGNRDFNSEQAGHAGRPSQRSRTEEECGETLEEKKREIYIPEEVQNTEELFDSAISAGKNFDNFDNIEVKVTGSGATDFSQVQTFEEAGLRDFLLNNIRKSGYRKPTPIQKRAIPIIMGKRDLMGCAQTGRLYYY